MEPTSTGHDPNGVVVSAASVPVVSSATSATTEPRTYDHFPHRLSTGLGIGQAIAGGLCVVFNSISAAYAVVYGFFFIGHGIWSGILFCVTGGTGIDAAKVKTKGHIVAYLVLCIVSSIVAAVVTALSIVEAKEFGNQHVLLYCVGRYNQSSACHTLSVEIAMESCVAVSAYTALVLCIWGAIVCLKTVAGCCSRPSLQQQDRLL